MCIASPSIVLWDSEFDLSISLSYSLNVTQLELGVRLSWFSRFKTEGDHTRMSTLLHAAISGDAPQLRSIHAIQAQR